MVKPGPTPCGKCGRPADLPLANTDLFHGDWCAGCEQAYEAEFQAHPRCELCGLDVDREHFECTPHGHRYCGRHVRTRCRHCQKETDERHFCKACGVFTCSRRCNVEDQKGALVEQRRSLVGCAAVLAVLLLVVLVVCLVKALT